MKKEMSQARKENLIWQYKLYSKIDWVIAITIIGLTFIPVIIPLGRYIRDGMMYGAGLIDTQAVMDLTTQEGGGFSEVFNNIPLFVMIPLFIVFSAYNIWSFWLYVKVWPIKEVPKGFQYWLDWVLSLGLTAYELFLFYLIIF